MADLSDLSMTLCRRVVGRRVMSAWILLGGLLGVFPLWLLLNGQRFDWERRLSQIPGGELAVAMIGAGLVYLLLVPLIRHTLTLSGAEIRRAFFLVVAVGAAFRAVMMATTPALEDDFYRYLWEGALVANHISPYAVSPDDAKAASPDTALGMIAKRAGPVLSRVNHPALTSTYPPVAQLAFALSHAIAPWNFFVWRGLCLIGDSAVMLLLIALLGTAGRSSLWAALYWWNPLILKELINAAHMEAVLMALVVAALLLSARGRYVASLIVLALAIGMKLWPLLLAPLLLGANAPHGRRLAIGGATLFILSALIVLPYLFALGPASGLLAYAKQWTTNSALFPVIERITADGLAPFGLAPMAWAVSRGLVGAALVGFSLWMARRPAGSTTDFMIRVCTVAGALVLLSPAQFPWYMVWMLPFAVFLPVFGLLAVTATTPLYYYSFHLIGRGEGAFFTTWVVWLIWLPIWLLLFWHLYRAHRPPASKPSPADEDAG